MFIFGVTKVKVSQSQCKKVLGSETSFRQIPLIHCTDSIFGNPDHDTFLTNDFHRGPPWVSSRNKGNGGKTEMENNLGIPQTQNTMED